MELRTITDSDDLVRQCYAYYSDLRREMDQWLKQSVRLDPPGPNQGGEDEANYAFKLNMDLFDELGGDSKDGWKSFFKTLRKIVNLQLPMIWCIDLNQDLRGS